MIGVFDHGTTGILVSIRKYLAKELLDARKILKERAKAESRKLEILDENSAVMEICSCDVVVCHVGGEAWQTLLSEKHSGVLIRVGSKAFGRNEIGTDPLQDIKGRFIFHLCVDPQSVTSEDWKTILDTVKSGENCESLVNGGNPAGIGHFFFPARTERITALAILCQGYLSTAALTMTEPLDGLMRSALNSIGYNSESATRVVVGENADLRERMTTISRRGWWTDYLIGKSSPQFIWNEFKREWNDAKEWERLNNFLRSLGIVAEDGGDWEEPTDGSDLGKTKAAEVMVEQVAGVYSVLAEFLGGKSK
jgi:hypothetical protein